jgi:hypothetical protein
LCVSKQCRLISSSRRLQSRRLQPHHTNSSLSAHTRTPMASAHVPAAIVRPSLHSHPCVLELAINRRRFAPRASDSTTRARPCSCVVTQLEI